MTEAVAAPAAVPAPAPVPVVAAGEGSRRYPGAQSFTESADDRARFFGRVQESEALYLRVLSVPLLVHFGRSGLGKTSLLQAGLFPLLRRKPLLPVMVRLQDSQQTLVAAVASGLREACRHEGLKCVLDEQVAGLWELLRDTAIWRDGMLLTPVLVFDQFEEVFTLRDAAFRALLATELGALVDGTAPARAAAPAGPGAAAVPAKGMRPVRPPVKLVISLREDFLGGLQEFSQALPALFHERLRLEPMTVAAARDAITGPAVLTSDAAGRPFDVPPFRFSDEALQAMVRYLQGRAGVIEPFQLQLLCRHAEELARSRGGAGRDAQAVTLTLADFKGGADFDTVLKTFYQRCIEALPRLQRLRARRLCEEGLLDGDGHRLMLDVGQIERDYRVSDDTLKRLDRDRLLRREPRLESVFYEISHDRLAGSILAARRFHLPQRWRYVIYGAVLVLASLTYTAWVLQAARERAESLVSFLLGERFLGQVRDAGLSEQLRQVQAQTVATRESAKRGINRGLALRNAGDIARMAGQSAQAVQLYQAALSNFDTTLPAPAAAGSAPPAWAPGAAAPAALAPLREAARTHTRLGEAVGEQGQIDDALGHHRQAAELWTAIDASGHAAAEDCVGWAASLMHQADLLQRQGVDQQALALVQTVMDKAQHVLLGADAIAPACRSRPSTDLKREVRPVPDTDAMALVGQSALLYGILLGRGEDVDGAQRISAWVRWQQPLSTSARTGVLTASTHQARLQAASRPDLTAANYRRSLDELDELLRLDAGNQQWRRERAAMQLLLAGLLADCLRQQPDTCPGVEGSGRAGVLALEALATMRQLVHTDAANQAWRLDLAWALQTYADTLTLPGVRRDDEALLAYDQARALLQPLADQQGHEAQLTLSRLLVQRAVAVARMGNDLRAVDGYNEAITLLDGLLAKRPDSTALLGELQSVLSRLAAHSAHIGNTPATAAVAAVTRLAAENRAAALDGRRKLLIQRKRAAEEAVVASDGEALLGHIGRQLEAGKADEVLPLASGAASRWRRFISLRPAAATGYRWLAECSHLLAKARDMRSQVDAADTANKQARLLPAIAAMHASGIARLLDDQPAAQVRQSFLRTELADLLADDGRPGETLVLFEQAVIDGEELLNPRRSSRLLQPQSVDERVRYLLALRDAQLLLGQLRDSQDVGGWEEAMRGGLLHVHEALALQPGNAVALMGQGELLHYLGDPQMRNKKGDALLPELRLAREAYLKARILLQAAAEGNERDKRLHEVDEALSRLDAARPR
jgi:hypothetical protein